MSSSLVSRAREGDPRAVARLISLVEDESPLLREVTAALAPHTGHAKVVGITGAPGVGKSTSTSALVGELAQGRPAGRRPGGRPVVAVLRRRPARRPGAHAGPRARPRGLHPVDGLARPPRRAGVEHPAGDPGPRRGRVRHRADRDRRRRTERGRDRRTGRHDARPPRTRHGRRHPGGEGRDPRDRRPLRDQQGRSGRRRHTPSRAPVDARSGRTRRGRLGASDPQDDRVEERRARRGRRGDRPAPRLAASPPASSPSGVRREHGTRSRRSR